jgi:hypothetical protein
MRPMPASMEVVPVAATTWRRMASLTCMPLRTLLVLAIGMSISSLLGRFPKKPDICVALHPS